jgi:Putative DNA-binding domain
MPRHRPEPPDLARAQRQMWRLVTAPEGVAASLAAAGDAGGRSIAWIAGDPALPAASRLEVYANAYFERLLEALGDDYAALAAALGPEAFHDLVAVYLIAHPPRHPSLRHAGARLAALLEYDPAAAPFRLRCPFAADLARLEWALAHAFDAADATPLAREALVRVAPERWPVLRLHFHPSVQLLRVDWPVHALRTACERGEPAPSLERHRLALGVWRRDERVRYRALDALEADLLEAALAGAPFEALCERAAHVRGEPEAPAAAAAHLGEWVDSGMVVGIAER